MKSTQLSKPHKGAKSETTRNRTKISKMVQEQLLPGENAIGEIPAGRSDLIATDKRLLRFSSGGCEAVEYANIAEVSYKVPHSKRLAARIVFGICIVVSLMITVGVWASALDSSVRNVSISDAIIICVVCIGIVGCAVWGIIFLDFGYYQIKIQSYGKPNIKVWRLPRRFSARSRVDRFVKVLKEQIAFSR